MDVRKYIEEQLQKDDLTFAAMIELPEAVQQCREEHHRQGESQGSESGSHQQGNGVESKSGWPDILNVRFCTHKNIRQEV